MHLIYLPNAPPKRINTIWADHRTCLQLINWMEHHSKWPHEEINTSQHWLQLTGTSVKMSSRWSNQIWAEHTKYQYRLNKLNAQPLYASSTIFFGRSNVHQDHNTSPLREVQLFTSTWSLNQLPLPILENPNTPNSFIRVASPNVVASMWLPTYLTQGIKPSVVQWASPSSSNCD